MIFKEAARVHLSLVDEFTGQPRDAETGLDDFGFRYNSSTLGRWMTPDPAGNLVASPANPQTWNQYAYVMNNPTTWTDPNGLDPGDNQFQRPAGEGCLNDPYGEDPKIFDACGGFAGFAGGGAAWNVFQIDPFSLIGINAKVTDPFELRDFSDPTLLSAVDLTAMSNEHGVAISYGIGPASPLPPMPLGPAFTLFGSEPGASAGGGGGGGSVAAPSVGRSQPGFWSCTFTGAIGMAWATTALDAVGVIPGGGNVLHGVQFGAAVAAAGVSALGGPTGAGLSATGAGLAIADRAGTSIAAHGVEMIPVLGNAISVVAVGFDIFGGSGLIAAYRGCMAGIN